MVPSTRFAAAFPSFLIITLCVSGCSDPLAEGQKNIGSETGKSGTGGPVVVGASPSPDYGTDGYETINGVNFVSAQSMFDRYARGEIMCYQFQFSDNSCTSAEYSTAVRKTHIDGSSFAIERNSDAKQIFPFRLFLKGKYLCSTTTEADVENWTIVRAGDRIPKSSVNDTVLEKSIQDQWRDAMKRNISNRLGVENCYRYSAVYQDGAPVAGQYKEHRFVDGIEQPQRREVIFSTFKGSDLDLLRLRPDIDL